MSPNTAPVTQNDSNAWSLPHMKRYLFTMRGATCVTLQPHQILRLPGKMTRVIDRPHIWNVIYIFTMSGAASVTPQPHQTLRLPRKMTPMLGPRHIWNVTYNARSSRCHPPTSPNIAPAAKNATAKLQRKFPKTGETSFTMRGRSENDPSMIRPWNRQSATRLATEVTFRGHHEHLISPTTFRTPAIIQSLTKCCPCHEKWHSNLTTSDALDSSITCLCYYLTISMTCWFNYFTILLRDSSIAWRLYYLTTLLLDGF